MLGSDCPYPDKSPFIFDRAVWDGVKIPSQYNNPSRDVIIGWIPSILFPLGGCSIITCLIVAALSPIAGVFTLVTGVGLLVLASLLADREKRAREHPYLPAIRALFSEYCDLCDLQDQPKAQEAFARARELAWLPWREHQQVLAFQYGVTGALATTDAAATLAAHEEVDRRVQPTIKQ